MIMDSGESMESGDSRFESKPEITIAFEKGTAFLDQFDRGDFIPWKIFENAIGIRRWYGEHWNQVYKRLLIYMNNQRGIVVTPERGAGLRLLTHKQAATEVPKKRHKRMFRQAGRALSELNTVDPACLSDQERKVLQFQVGSFKSTRRQIRKDLKYEVPKTETHPKRSISKPKATVVAAVKE